MLTPGQHLEVSIEKPAAGGRMIARHEGQIVLVAGAIPGERVVARVERSERQLAFAATARVLEPSADRRPAFDDPLCGGCVYSHIQYTRQLALKREVIADAFARIGRVPLPSSVDIAGSAERAYRMRARLHVRDGRAGFYREGTHELCDAAATRQLSDACADAVLGAAAHLHRAGLHLLSIEVAENISGKERAVYVELNDEPPVDHSVLSSLLQDTSVTGFACRTPGGRELSAGNPFVCDPLSILTDGRAATGTLCRHAESFFQGNRFLLARLVTAVLDASDGDEKPILDLYAGVGLFSIALAATGRGNITAVEGDRSSASDLERNAAQFASAIRVVVGRVEAHVPRTRDAQTIIVDPPRTGLSREALNAIARAGAGRIVYVSCDPPTMARDARRLMDAGYHLRTLRGFDLFPNTPHVECVGVFTGDG